MKKVLNTVMTVVETIITIVLLILVLLLAFQRFSNNSSFFGYRIFTVASDSMIPIYTIGDTLLIKDTEVSELKVGDALTYMGTSGSMKGKIITHQVVAIDVIDGEYQFHTKGTANQIEDPIVYEDQVFGKVIYKFTLLSILGKITTNMSSLLIFITIPIAILIAVEIIKIYRSKDEDDDEAEEEMDSSDENLAEEIKEDISDEESLNSDNEEEEDKDTQ